MMNINLVSVSCCVRALILGIACAAISACTADTPSTPVASSPEPAEQQGEPAAQMDSQHISRTDTVESADDAGRLTMPAREFLRELLSLNKNLAGGGNFNLPAIWIFSPQGELVNIVQGEQALAAFQLEFSAIDPQAPNMTCQSMEQTVINAANAAWSMGCADGKWIALSLIPTRCGEHCTNAENVLAQVEQEHHAELQVRTVLVDFGT